MAIVKIDDKTREQLSRLAEEEHDTFGHLIARALDAFEEARYWRQAEAAALALRADDRAWREELDERQAWDSSLTDECWGIASPSTMAKVKGHLQKLLDV